MQRYFADCDRLDEDRPFISVRCTNILTESNLHTLYIYLYK